MSKVVVITGGNSGIGEACAWKFAREQYTVIVCGRDHVRNLRVCEGINREMACAHSYAVDLRSPTELTDLFKQLALDHPPINCLVNSIGIDGRSFTMTEDYPEADFDDVMSTNVRAPWQCMKAVLPAMREAGHGTIVNVASLAGLNASVTGGSVYTASKHALVGITRAVAKEYAPYGVRVNAVCPGFVSTPLAKHVLGSKFDSVCASQPMRRVCEAHEVAELVYWLSSEAASYVTGVAVPIDGGFRA